MAAAHHVSYIPIREKVMFQDCSFQNATHVNALKKFSQKLAKKKKVVKSLVIDNCVNITSLNDLLNVIDKTHLGTIEKFVLRPCPTQFFFIKLVNHLPNLRRFKIIQSEDDFGDDACNMLCQVIEYNETIKDIEIFHCFKENGKKFSLFVDALIKNKNITSLNVFGVFDTFIPLFTKLLNFNRTIEYLNLWHTRLPLITVEISDDEFMSFCEAIERSNLCSILVPNINWVQKRVEIFLDAVISNRQILLFTPPKISFENMKYVLGKFRSLIYHKEALFLLDFELENEKMTHLFGEFLSRTTSLKALQIELRNENVYFYNLLKDYVENNGSLTLMCVLHGQQVKFEDVLTRNKANHKKARLICETMLMIYRRSSPSLCRVIGKDVTVVIAKILNESRCDIEAWTNN